MLKRFINDIKKYFHYSIVSAKSQLKADVAGSYLNWMWWILDPLCFMLIYAFIFGYVFNASEKHFAVFIFIGLTMWNFFNNMLKSSTKIVKNNKSVVSKVYFPKYILILSKMWVNGFKMLISFGIVIVMMVIYQVPLSWNIFLFIPILLIYAMLAFGICCFLLHFGVYVEDLSNVTALALRFVFYLSGIFYNIEKRIAGWGELFNLYNPVAFFITSMRKCLIYCETPNLTAMGIWFAVALVLCVLGVRKIYKEENSYVKSI